MTDDHDLYLQMDVLLLSDVFQNFREIVMSHFMLDPLHFFTLPSLAWQCALKKSKVKLELITDPDMYLMFENSLRGGISMISNRYAKANNPDADDYDATKPRSYITYLDCNNLYGTSMTERLPTGNFRFLSPDEISNFDVTATKSKSKTGYILEVDLTYPQELHDKHSDYPLAPEKLTVTDDMLSDYSLSFPNRPRPTEKLIPNLRNKSNYVVHYENLKLYLRQGLILTKIHRILEFRQKAWLK